MVDPDTGEPGISKMDEKNLKDIADEISGTYVAVNASQTLADSVSAKSSKQWRMTTTVKERTRTTPVVWPRWRYCLPWKSVHGSQPQGDCCEKQ